MAAMVAADNPELGFYITIAANASSGLDQARHRFVSRLYRDGYADAAVDSAKAFLTTHMNVARGMVAWEEYVAYRTAVENALWYQDITGRFNMTYDNLEDATGWGSSVEAAPAERDFERVRVPTLGVFFEFDHSNPQDPPVIFKRAMANNRDAEVHIIPGANHGGWAVDGYRWSSQTIDGRIPEFYSTVANWVDRFAAPPGR
jgi:pimeloyl-ACP methyl ester carboxylesterase